MADLVRALEADLFGAYAWAADSYQELLAVPEPEARALVADGLLRAVDRLLRDDTADAPNRAPVGADELRVLSDEAAAALAAAEDAVTPDARTFLAALQAPREALLEAPDEATAQAFLAAFDPLWARGPREPLVADALLSALARSNLLEPRLRRRILPEEGRALHAAAARTYDEAAGILRGRVARGESVWQETADSALHRAARVWHLAGDAAETRGAEEREREWGVRVGERK
ncbi:MAG TPA: hypothetical protein VI997_05035 [Candidatus Thermoplasmatota archaeon]|nr:hypothetical protein [Candidatus Thermoplasmatota archaeon]